MINNPWIDRICKEFDGKELFYCKTSGIGGTRINFNSNDISFCHEAELSRAPREVRHISGISDFSVDKYYEQVYDLVNKFQNEDFLCRKCSQCIKGTYRFSKIRYVTICPSMICNSKCIYCSAHVVSSNKGDYGYNPIIYLKKFDEYGYFEQNCLFDWGGGEPTMSTFFEETVHWLLNKGYKQRINTNAIEFSNTIYEALKNNEVILRISPDSGTRKGYYKVKGTDSYYKVWNNIEKYASVSNEVYIKYNVFNLNSDEREIGAFINMCKDAGIKHIIIDAEISSYQKKKNYGPFYFTPKEFKAIHMLEKKGREIGAEIDISGYSFGTRPEYDDDGKLKLPTAYFDNIDHDVITSGIYLYTYADLDIMIENELIDLEDPLILFGAGEMGEKISNRLKDMGVKYKLIDNYKTEVSWYNKSIEKASKYLLQLKESKNKRAILITARDYKEMLYQINVISPNVSVFWVENIE